MDIFFNTLKKGLLATIFIVFAFVATYTPQLPTSQVPEVEAGAGLGNFGTELTQLVNSSFLGSNVVQTTLTAGATVSNWVKENVLDGLGWAIAKRIVSGMIQSLINWVNSGFQGSPSFIQDFRGFLLNIADEEIGRVISELGDIGSFICSPFRLDVQISVALQYQRGREEQSAPSCTLSGIVSNIEGFIQGVDFSGGLADWFTITSTPQTYTPYGAALSAQATARARLINAEGEEIKLLDFGDGFQSQKLCRSVSGFTGSQDCSIVKPGRVIADQINNALDTGRQTLVEADEINELIAALLGQLANTALTGVAGLLGLSGGDGFGGYSNDSSYLDDLVGESDDLVIGAGGAGSVLEEDLAIQNEYRDDMVILFDRYLDFATATTTSAEDVVSATEVIIELNEEINTTQEHIVTLETMSSAYATGTDQERVDILIEYTTLSIPDAEDISNNLAEWEETANELGVELAGIEEADVADIIIDEDLLEELGIEITEDDEDSDTGTASSTEAGN